MQRGFLCLVAVMDRARCKALSWRLSNTLDADSSVATLESALDRQGKPEIFNPERKAVS
jgi:putative transposase